jgi:hypothetical protein
MPLFVRRTPAGQLDAELKAYRDEFFSRAAAAALMASLLKYCATQRPEAPETCD